MLSYRNFAFYGYLRCSMYERVNMKNIIVITLSLLVCAACRDAKKEQEYPILNVSLEKKDVSIKSLFDRFEVIPLETNDSSLLIWPDKIFYWNGYYEVFDSKAPALFVFDEKGKFVRKVGRRGKGPEEYTEIYDVVQDKGTGGIYMLSPFGELLSYNSEGTFEKRVRLPQKSNYQSFESYGDYIVTWTLPNGDDEHGISLISKDIMQCVKNYWRGNRNLYFLYPKAFYKYGEDLFFFRPFGREVYQIEKDEMSVAYKWDFGPNNYSITDWGISEVHSGEEEESSLLMKRLKDSTIPYVIASQAQTERFYYAKLVLGFTPEGQYHIFYRKEDGKSFFFKETLEGIRLNPLLWNDEFVLCLASNENLDGYIQVLEKSELFKISNRKEDDNPVLVKCYWSDIR